VPAVTAYAAACACTDGSSIAYLARTESRIRRKLGFPVKEEGVGGMAVVVPIARAGLGGLVGRRERMLMLLFSEGKVYCGWLE